MRGESLPSYYFFAEALAFFAGAALALGAAGATAGAALSAVRWSRKTVISAAILFLRSVSFAMLAVSLAIAFAVLDTGAFLGAALATGFCTFAGATTFLDFTAALGATFFAVAIFHFSCSCDLTKILSGAYCRQSMVLSMWGASLYCGLLPDWGGEEVTGKKAWDNESLARNGWPI